MKNILISFLLIFLVTPVVNGQNKRDNSNFIKQVLENEGIPLDVRLEIKKVLSPSNSKVHAASHLNSTKSQKQNLKAERTSTPFKNVSQNGPSLIKFLNQQNTNYFRERLDHIEYFDPVNVPIMDSMLIEQCTYETDLNGYVSQQICQQLDTVSNQMKNTSKSEIKNNSEGKPLEQVDFEWDGSGWQPSEKIVHIYKENSGLILKSYNWNSSSADWIKSSEIERAYFENNQTDSIVIKSFAEDDSSIVVSKTLIRYFENGELKYHFSGYNWNSETGSWDGQMKQTVTLNNDGKKVAHTFEWWDKDEEKWIRYRESIFEYQNDGSIVETETYYKHNTDIAEFVNEYHYRFFKEYAGGRLVEEVKQEKAGDNWYDEWKKVYAYDASGNQVYFGYYIPYGGWQLVERDEREYSDQGQPLSYVYELKELNQETYQITGLYFIEDKWHLNGTKAIEKEYQWDLEKRDWTIKTINYFDYSAGEGFTSSKYLFQQTGTETVFEKEDYDFNMEYDMNLGKYTRIVEGSFTTEIEYNSNQKVQEVLFASDYEKEKIEVFYDEAGRDTLWVYTDWFDNNWRFKMDKTISYDETTSGLLKITEHSYDHRPDTIYGEHGEIVGMGYNVKEIYYFDEDRLTACAYYDYENSSWVPDDSTTYTYNENGQLISYSNTMRDYRMKTVCQYNNDTLEILEYRKYLSESDEWNLRWKSKVEVDEQTTEDYIQMPPVQVFDNREYAFIWYSYFDYGKILSATEYECRDNIKLSGKSLFYYASAKTLSGNSAISGYVYDKSGAEKSISITNASDGSPMKDVSVSLLDKKDDFILATVQTDSAGFYKFEGVPSGTFYLHVELDGYDQETTYDFEVGQDSAVYEDNNFSVTDGEILTGLLSLSDNEIEIFPNPTTGYLCIESPVNILSITITDLSGKTCIRQKTSLGKNKTINLQQLNNGIYVVQVETAEGIFERKIVVGK